LSKMTNERENAFSFHDRERIMQQMAEGDGRPLDLLVIGGGITGCGIALDAALRGLRVGLVEMQDFAQGTSSRSTKLIHGGLRYLKQGELKLVREVGRERAILHENAPHIVIPEPMLLPLYRGGTYGKLMTSIGLWIYDRLAGVQKAERRRMLTKAETVRLEPLLKPEDLIGGGLYVEYRTDDARLTLEVAKTAAAQGALVVNYAHAEEFIYEDGKVTGASVKDTKSGRTYAIRARKIINAAGPWVDELRKKDRSLHGKRLHLTKGVHIVVDQSQFPLKQAIYFDVEGGRMIFAIPRDGKTYIGTTDTNYTGSIEEPHMTKEDRAYLLQAANAMFPSIHLAEDDVEAYWVGLRPLIHQEGKSPSELSRKDEIFRSESGLITIAGGKLTGFRRMAQRVIDLAVSELEAEEHRTFGPCRTDRQVLSGGDVGGGAGWQRFSASKLKELMQRGLGLSPQRAAALIHRYGSNIDQLLTFLPPDNIEKPRLLDHDPVLAAEVAYCVEHEMAGDTDDFFTRRTGAAYFNASYAKERLDAVAACINARHRSNTHE
jgi:glycerol-3-phosphate dehydrogenase